MLLFTTPSGRTPCPLTSSGTSRSKTSRCIPHKTTKQQLSYFSKASIFFYQLQDTLIQKEEELARLQEENNKLKEFLNSSYVKSLEDKSKRIFSEGRQRKRALHDETDFVNLSRLLQGGEGKRTCRNLSLEFCSADEVAATPPLDSWVLETLGLQDEDTINTDSSFSSPTTDHTPTFSSPAPSTDHFSPALQDSTMYSPYSSDSHCEYSGPIESSCGFSHGMDGSEDFWSLGTSRMYTVTLTGSLRDLPNRHFSPPKAASTPQRPHIRAQSIAIMATVSPVQQGTREHHCPRAVELT
ncbi:geminin coiled-coil domain-containing protein 1 isoform X2 [Silurus meridionalis]|uniref:geminin coiled-coil domain-containing protein 1 isoform X2 n=1 Tax=Silurus meridionalis TaxID=175797 RepID=UPI001EEABB13|nr:geminin coiled-coil domain-containing protein 1 isoform X2 [Silurus meridionalis]